MSAEKQIIQKLLAWNKKYPKTALLMQEDMIRQSVLELDDIMTEAQQFNGRE